MKNATTLGILALLFLTMLTTSALATALPTNTTADLIGIGPEISISLINQDPTPATAGDTVEVRLGLANAGLSTVNGLIVELVPSYPFSVPAGEGAVQNVGTINRYQVNAEVKIVKFKVKTDREANAGTYNLKVYTYKEGDRNNRVEQTIPVDITSHETAEIIYIDQVELLPGKITPLKFTINNVGSAPLRDMTFTWENPDGIILPVGSDNTKYIKYLDVDESAVLEYQVIASGSAEPDLYALALTLTFTDPVTGATSTTVTTAGIYVGGETDFDVTYSGTSGSDLSFSISNIGATAASAVTVSVPRQYGWTASGSSSAIIGNLNEGDYTIATFSLQRAGGADTTTTSGAQPGPRGNVTRGNMTGPSTVKIEVSYTDSRGSRHTVEKEVVIGTTAATMNAAFAGRNARQASSGTNYWLLSGVIIIVLAIAAFGYVRYRKHHAADEEEKRRKR